MTWFDDAAAAGIDFTAGAPITMYVKAQAVTDPAESYSVIEYDYNMTGAAGGLTMVEQRQSNGEKVAKITGTTPADQIGLSLTVTCTCVDKAGTSKDATDYTEEWL